MQTANIQEWENAEIARSVIDAQNKGNDFVLRGRDLTRYMDPPANSIHPLEYAFHLLGDSRGKRVVDYGCGAGEDAVHLARRGADVIGIDISADLLQIAKRRVEANGESAKFLVASAYATGLPSESVDAVFAIAILHHLDLELTKKEIWRILRPGGVMVLQEPVRDSATLRFLRKLVPYRSPDVSPFERPLTTSELITFGKGFNLESTRYFCLPYGNIIRVPGGLRFVEPVLKLDALLLDRISFLQRYASVCIMKLIKPI